LNFTSRGVLDLKRIRCEEMERSSGMTSYSDLVALSGCIVKDEIGISKPWGSADVCIVKRLPKINSGGFYPEPRFVVTDHGLELSWLFEQLRDIFKEIEDYGLWKEEIFGRLGNTANRYLTKSPTASARELLLAIMHETFSIIEEIEVGDFRSPMVTSNNRIYDDLILENERNEFLGVAETLEFFKNKGIG
jgi:hypothetical protein